MFSIFMVNKNVFENFQPVHPDKLDDQLVHPGELAENRFAECEVIFCYF